MPTTLIAAVVAITPKGTVEWLGLIAASLGFIATIWKLGIKPMIQFFRAIAAGVEFIRTEMDNNGGSTKGDAIDRIDAKTDSIVERLDAIDARVEFLEAVHRRQEEVDAIVAENSRKLALRPTLPPSPPKESA